MAKSTLENASACPTSEPTIGTSSERRQCTGLEKAIIATLFFDKYCNHIYNGQMSLPRPKPPPKAHRTQLWSSELLETYVTLEQRLERVLRSFQFVLETAVTDISNCASDLVVMYHNAMVVYTQESRQLFRYLVAFRLEWYKWLEARYDIKPCEIDRYYIPLSNFSISQQVYYSKAPIHPKLAAKDSENTIETKKAEE